MDRPKLVEQTKIASETKNIRQLTIAPLTTKHTAPQMTLENVIV